MFTITALFVIAVIIVFVISVLIGLIGFFLKFFISSVLIYLLWNFVITALFHVNPMSLVQACEVFICLWVVGLILRIAIKFL